MEALLVVEKAEQAFRSTGEAFGMNAGGGSDAEHLLGVCIDAVSFVSARNMFQLGIKYFLELVCPITFSIMLSFNHFSYNSGMFYVLSDLSDEDFAIVQRNVLLNFIAALVNSLFFALCVRRSRKTACGALFCQRRVA